MAKRQEVFSVLCKILNIREMMRRARKSTCRSQQWDPATDIDLKLYSRMFDNGCLHYGYFPTVPDDADSISFAAAKRAMEAYTELIVSQIPDKDRPVLDVGCGMGALLRQLSARGYRAAGVTPNRDQLSHLRLELPGVEVVSSRFEDLYVENWRSSFGTVVNSESLQYIDLDVAMDKVTALLAPGGRWVVADYYRLQSSSPHPSGHLLADFLEKADKHGFVVDRYQDITENVTPSLGYLHSLACKIALPLLDHLIEQMEISHPVLGYLFGDILMKVAGRQRRNLDYLDPRVFARDKVYVLTVLSRGAGSCGQEKPSGA